MNLYSIFFATGLLSLCPWPIPALGQEKARVEEKSIRELVQQLASPKYEEREAATKALLSLDEALPQLKRALKSENAERARRAKIVLMAIANRSQPKYAEYARQGRIDLLVELLAVSPETLDTRVCWVAVHDFARDLLRRAKLLERYRDDENAIYRIAFDTHRRSLGTRFLYGSDGHDWPARTDNYYLRSHRSLGANFIYQCVITCAGTVTLEKSRASIIFANSDVDVKFPGESVIVSDGTINTKRSSSNVLIARRNVVVRGDILLPVRDSINDSHLVAGGRVQIENIGNAWVKSTVIKERQRGPHGVRFFEITDVGIEVSAAKEGVKVEKLAIGAPPARCGLQVGDVILTVDGIKSIDEELFRRQLRRAFVQDEATVTVRRGDKYMDLTIEFFGFQLPKPQ